jgi:hypothetical protein
MVREAGIKIRIEPLPYGAYTATPISKYWRDRFGRHILEWKYNGDPSGVPQHELCQAYFQGYYDLPEAVTSNRQFPELERGWYITILVDPWEFGHWLGYDAHTVAENL